MEFSQNNKIPTYQPEVSLNEDTMERTFICPVSRENVFSWDFESQNQKYPDELVCIDYEQVEEPFYIKTEFAHTLHEWIKNKDGSIHDAYESFIDYFISKLPKNELYYCLALEDPDWPNGGETTYMIYRGKYAGE